MEIPKYKSVEDFEDRYLIDFECSGNNSLIMFLKELENEYHTKWMFPEYFDELMELQGDFEMLLGSELMELLWDFCFTHPSNDHKIKAKDFEQISGKKIETAKLLRYIELDLIYREMLKRSSGYFVIQVYDTIKEKIKEQEILLKYRTSNLQSHKKKSNQTLKLTEDSPIHFKDLFVNPDDSEHYLTLLMEVNPNLISQDFRYIGKNKGGWFSLFIELLKKQGIIKHFTDNEYRDALNNRIKGLNLCGDEFRKNYMSIKESDNADLSLKFSQFSQKGKIGR